MGVDGLEAEAAGPPRSWVMTEGSRRLEALSDLTVLIEGVRGVTVSEDTVALDLERDMTGNMDLELSISWSTMWLVLHRLRRVLEGLW